jgi:predicted amidohydrolase
MPLAAAIQMTSSPDVRANLATARGLLEQAAQRGVVIAGLPENFAIMGLKDRDKIAVAEEDGSGPIQSWFAQVTRELKIWVIGGTIPLRTRDPNRVAAACLVVNSDGVRVARYDKIHLFDVDIPGRAESYRESSTIVPGNTPVVVETPIGRVGLGVCYDMRFPELFRELAEKGAEVLSLPSAFTVPTGQAHWEVLLRARAVENLTYVMAPAQIGRHANGRETYGHALIVDPWGIVLDRIMEGPGFAVAEINREAQREIRERFPALKHRKMR